MIHMPTLQRPVGESCPSLICGKNHASDIVSLVRGPRQFHPATFAGRPTHHPQIQKCTRLVLRYDFAESTIRYCATKIARKNSSVISDAREVLLSRQTS